MLDDILEVYETDADFSMESQNLKHQGFHLDIAETKMMLLFRASGYGKDYLIYNRNKQEILAFCLTSQTKRRRGECQA
jgi:hypothetical protein